MSIPTLRTTGDRQLDVELADLRKRIDRLSAPAPVVTVDRRTAVLTPPPTPMTILVQESDGVPFGQFTGIEIDQATNLAMTSNADRAKITKTADTTAPADIGSAAAAGTSTKIPNADHVHKGVHSLAKLAGTALYGDVTLSEGTGITLTPSGNDIAIASAAGSGVPTGAIIAYGGASAPTGYLLCDGSAVSRSTYSALFAIVSTAFGVGDGSTTFNVPDMRQRFPLGKAASGTGSTLGGTGGNIDHVHTVDPPSTQSGEVNEDGFTGATPAVGTTFAPHVHTHNTDIASFNSGTANPPFQAVTYIIKT